MKMSNAENNSASMPMKWHKFLINFSLWLNALGHLANAGLYGGGSVYLSLGISPNQVYAAYPMLSILDKASAVCYIGLMVLSIVARFSLARYEAKGPGLLLKLLLFTGVLPLVYILLGSVIGFYEINSSVVSTCAGPFILYFCNKTYYGKRAHLFVN